jgi:hypothetical protein
MSDAQRDEKQKPDNTEQPRSEPATGTQSGVLGNLPKTRPSVRSPRRAERKPAAEPKPTPRRADQIPGSPAQPDGSRQSATGEHSSPSSTTAEIEALARSGIAIAGEAASLGLKFAGRAAAAIRDAVERR